MNIKQNNKSLVNPHWLRLAATSNSTFLFYPRKSYNKSQSETVLHYFCYKQFETKKL